MAHVAAPAEKDVRLVGKIMASVQALESQEQVVKKLASAFMKDHGADIKKLATKSGD